MLQFAKAQLVTNPIGGLGWVSNQIGTTNLCDSVTLARATPRGSSSPMSKQRGPECLHAILSFKGSPRESCRSMGGDEMIHIVFGYTIDVESIPISTDGVNDIACVAV